ncbi:MAG: ABC transporter substrate-binding protein [Actinobacteria bacterium]|nr:ABC transporter substrate-binding protein [Actinomycetota bacterium]
MKPSRSFTRVIAGAAAVALLATACGGDDDTTDEPTDGATAAPTDGGTATDGEVPTELSGVTVVDDRTLEVALKSPDPAFVQQLQYPGYYAVPQAFFDDPEGFDEQPIGNGPFMLTEPWNHDVEIVTEAFPDYQGSDPPDAPGIIFAIYPDSETAYTDLIAGNLDVSDELPAPQVADAQERFGDRFGESPDTSINYLGLPSYVDWLADNPQMRAALSMAIDRAAITSTVLDDTRDPAAGFIAPGIPGARSEDAPCPNWAFDADAAAAAFEEAGGLDALPETLEIWFNTGSVHELWTEAVANQWNQVLGIPIERVAFQGLEFSEYLPLSDEQGFTGPFRLGWGMDYPHPQNFLEPLFHSASHPPAGSNTTFYTNPDFDAKLAEANETAASEGLDAAIPLYQEAEDMLCNDITVIPMFYGQNQYAWNETVDNVFVDAFGDINYTEITADAPFTTFIVEPEHLTPMLSNESEGIAVLKGVFKGLVDTDPRTTETFLQHAESIESEDGGQTWTIVLKDGWTWHDGTAITAQDYANAWNFAALGSNGAQNNSFFSNWQGYDEMNPPSATESPTG